VYALSNPAQSIPALLGAIPAAEGDEGGFWATAAPIIPHPLEFFFGLVVFAIIYVVVRRQIVPRLEKIYAERTAAIEGGIEKAEAAQAAAQAALEEYNNQLKDAREEAARIREDAKAQGALIIAELREKANQEAARIADSAQKQLEAERQQAVVQLRGEVGRLSTDLASRIVGESLEDETRQRGIVERFLAELESGAIAPEPVGAPTGGGTSGGATLADSVGDAGAGGQDAVAGGRAPTASPGSGTGQDI
jgi:F-type H+-transporting ATPase subunit b